MEWVVGGVAGASISREAVAVWSERQQEGPQEVVSGPPASSGLHPSH